MRDIYFCWDNHLVILLANISGIWIERKYICDRAQRYIKFNLLNFSNILYFCFIQVINYAQRPVVVFIQMKNKGRDNVENAQASEVKPLRN